MNAQAIPAPPQRPLWLRELARDIHHALCDDGLAPLSPTDNHQVRDVIERVLQSDRRAADLARAPKPAPRAPERPEFNPRAFSLACTVAWTELVRALRADGHDVKDSSGPTVRKWMEGKVRDTFAAPTQPEPEWRKVLSALLDHVDLETCTHEETYRGGAIWTICDNCGRKWADDRGGFKPHEDAPAVAAARALLDAAPDIPARTKRPIPEGYKVICEQELARLRERDEVQVATERGDVWYWQGDGHDMPESLACPVVMSADTLRALIARATAPVIAEGCDVQLALIRGRALHHFIDYFVKNYPGPNTVISDPFWHAPRIFRAAQHALTTAATEGGALEH